MVAQEEKQGRLISSSPPPPQRESQIRQDRRTEDLEHVDRALERQLGLYQPFDDELESQIRQDRRS